MSKREISGAGVNKIKIKMAVLKKESYNGRIGRMSIKKKAKWLGWGAGRKMWIIFKGNKQTGRVEGFAKESFKGFQMCRNYAFKDAFQQKQTRQSVKKDECRQ